MRALFAALLITATPVAASLPALARSPELPGPAQEHLPGEPRPDLMPGFPPEGSPPQTQPDPAPDLDEPGNPNARAPQGKSLESAADPDRVKRLDALFAALKAAPDEDSAKAVAQRIDIALSPSGSATVDLLMTRAGTAVEGKDYDLAIQLLDSALKIEPDYLEAWNKRATIFYLKQDFADSLVDLRQVIAREPRHYGAWSGLAVILKELGDDKRALEAARQALTIYPQLDELKEMEESLAIKVEGRPI